MNVWYSFLIAISMYSRIPIPPVDWTKERMRYVFCFFPIIGIACGFGLWLWFSFAEWAGFSAAAAGLVGTAVPVFITGGIHLDGFLDTVDALSSYGDRDKKLEILKDPHTGAFALIGGMAYILCYAGLMIQWAGLVMGEQTDRFSAEASGALGAIFVMERSLSGLSVASFPCARGTGLAASFADSAQKRIVGICLSVWLLFCIAVLKLWAGYTGLLAGAGAGLVFWWYYKMAREKFGGITGDLAGWFLQICELAGLFILTVGIGRV